MPKQRIVNLDELPEDEYRMLYFALSDAWNRFEGVETTDEFPEPIPVIKSLMDKFGMDHA